MSTTPGRHEGLPSFGPSIRRHWVIVLLSMLAFVGLAAGYLSVAPSSFTSTSRLLLFPVPGNPLTSESASASSTQLTIAMETEAGIVTTPEVEALASVRIGRETPASDEFIQVRVPGGTQVVEISFTAPTAEGAAQGAQAFSEAFLEFRDARAIDTQDSLLATLEEQARTAEDNLRRASVEALDPDGGVFAQQEVELFTDRLAQLNERISSTEAVATNPGRLINPAELPEGSNGVSSVLVLGAAGMFGLMLGALIALFLEWRRDLVREGELADVAGVPVFATVANDGRSVSSSSGDPGEREAYRRLLAGIVANGPQPHALAVATIDTERRASSIATNLAATLAEARFSVLLIAADPDDRGVEQALDIPVAPGLSDVVQDGLDVRDVLVSAGSVTVLPGGSRPERVRELYAGPLFRGVLDSLRPRYDYIILASSSAGTGDGDAVISAADSVLISVTSGRTTYGEVSAALDRFDRLGIDPIGAVVTRASTDAGDRAQVGRPHGVEQVRQMVATMWPNATIDVRRAPALFTRTPSFAMLPSRSSPFRLLPVRPRRVALEATRAMGLQADPASRRKAALLGSAMRFGGARLLPNTLRIKERRTGSRASLLGHLEDAIGEPIHASIQLGPPRANRKPVLHLMDADGMTQAFVKVGVNSLTRQRIREETRALEELNQAPFEQLAVPRVLGAGSWRDCEYLVLSPLPPASDDVDSDDVRTLAMRNLVDGFECVETPLESSSWWTGWSQLLDEFSEVGADGESVRSSDAAALWDHAERLEQTCGERTLLFGAAHGDWTPWNMSIVDDVAHVWDWERFATDVPVGWDALHFAFQAEVRLSGLSPRDALQKVAGRSRSLVGENGAYAEDGPLLMALYALRLGSRFVVDGQSRAGEQNSALSQWLLPELESLVKLAGQTPVDA